MAGEVASWLPQQILRQHSHRPEHHLRWLVDDLRVSLILDIDGFPIDSAAYFSQITEIEAPGYIPGGEPLLQPGIMWDQPTRQVRLHCAPSRWEGTFTAEAAIIWKNVGDDARSPLLGIFDFDGPRMSVDGEFVIDWDPELGALAYEVVVPDRFGAVFA